MGTASSEGHPGPGHPGRGQQGPQFPRGVLLGAGLMILAVFAMVGFARIEGMPDTRPEGPPVALRLIAFEDQDDGGVRVRDAATGAVIADLAPGTNGFIRASMRGLARERRRAENGPETPFRLARWADGRLTLEDPTNGRLIDLVAFGHSQVQVFESFLDTRTKGGQG